MDDKNSLVKKKKKKKGSFLASDVWAIKSTAAAAGIYPKGSEERQAEDLVTPPPQHTHTARAEQQPTFTAQTAAGHGGLIRVKQSIEFFVPA